MLYLPVTSNLLILNFLYPYVFLINYNMSYPKSYIKSHLFICFLFPESASVLYVEATLVSTCVVV